MIGLLVIYVSIGYLKFENSYDSFHENSEELYRVGRTYRSQDYATVGFGNWSESTANEQLNQIKNIKGVAGIKEASQFIISNESEFLNYNDKNLEQDGILTTNTPSSFTSMFTWELIAGSFEKFNKLNTVLLNETTARKMTTGSFSDLINEPIEIAGVNYTIAAVIKDVPENSHFDFQIATHNDVISYWGSNLYIQLTENAIATNVLKQFEKDILKTSPNLATNDTFKGHFFEELQIFI